jgi:hypothetical protein
MEMAARVKADDSAAKAKYRYRVTNWAEYDRALVNRGNLTIWFDKARIAENCAAEIAASPSEGRFAGDLDGSHP